MAVANRRRTVHGIVACTAFLLWTAGTAPVAGEEAVLPKEEHDEHGDEQVVHLSAEEMTEFGIRVAEAGPGTLQVHVDMTGEVAIDPDRLAHVVPRVGGVVRKVRRKLGDRVRTGEILAEIDSQELSELKSAYLVARERMELAATTFTREETLWRDEISSEREYLQAKQALAEARIEMRAAEQKLHALGFSVEYVKGLTFAEDEQFTRYEIVAPFDGKIIEKHITYGEMIKDDAEVFVIADLSSVWVVFTLYQEDLPRIDLGQAVQISVADGGRTAAGTISYISPVVDEETRTTRAHVVLPNPEGRWRPGSFVSGKVSVEEIEVPLLVPAAAVQIVEGKSSVFVQTGEGFEPRWVRTGRVDEINVEIISGLSIGDRYVERGGFTLKAELAKDAFGDGHGH